MTPSGFQHGRIENRIQTLLSSFVLSMDLGEITPGDTGFWLEKNPDTVRAPDVAFVRKDRIPDSVTGFFPGPPDLSVEIRSPNDCPKEFSARIEDQLRLGVQVVWDVDPQKRTVTIHRPGAKPQVFSENDTLAESALLPGFEVTVKQFFPP
ncbi:MAG: Uma2 family endonuclease [Planctomycetota bacterium]